MSDIEKRVKKFINAKKLAIPMEIDNCDAKELDLIVDGSNNISIKIPKEGSAFEVKADDDDLKDVVKELNKFIKSVPRKLEDILQHIQEIWRKYVEADEDSDGSGGGSDDDDDDDDEDEDISSIEISTPISKEDQVDRKQFVYPSIATPSATQRLISDYVLMRDSNFKELGFIASPKNKNLYIWEVKMIPPEGTDLDKDFQKLKKSKGIEWIELEVMFPSTWPNEPPFVRVIGPRFVFRTGHVTVGGSICMDLLTMSGWKPIYTLDQVILQIRTEMGHGGGRLDIGNNQPYNINEARSAFQRVASDHKWIIPKHENLPDVWIL